MNNASPKTTGPSQWTENQAVVLFDGVCNLCNGAVQFIIKRDRRAHFRFGALQSDAANGLLRAHADPASIPDSLVLFENGRVYVQSTAVLRIARKLGGLWPLAYGFIVLPRTLRDWVYSWVARNRYRWFGKRDTCMMPTPELRARFIDTPVTS